MADLRLVPPPEPRPEPKIRGRELDWWVIGFVLVFVVFWLIVVPVVWGDGGSSQPGYGTCVASGC